MSTKPSSNPSDPDREITRLLDGMSQAAALAKSGAPRLRPPSPPLAELVPLIYRQLRAMAQRHLADERRDHTLQATALVHEAYLRIAPPSAEGEWAGRTHFFRAAAEAMEHILIDHARARLRKKRGGPGRARVDFAAAEALALSISENPEDVIALDEAVQRLREREPRAAEVVRLRFYAGLSVDETAKVLGVSPRTVDLDWKFARAFLFTLLNRDVRSADEGGPS